MSDKKDWGVYEQLGCPVLHFFLFANAAKVYSSAHGLDQRATTPGYAAALTEEMCEEWLDHHQAQAKEVIASRRQKEPDRPEPLGAMAPPMQQAPALCGHQSDPDPNGTRHTCHIPGKHIGVHEDQEWSWFPTDWKPARKTL